MEIMPILTKYLKSSFWKDWSLNGILSEIYLYMTVGHYIEDGCCCCCLALKFPSNVKTSTWAEIWSGLSRQWGV